MEDNKPSQEAVFTQLFTAMEKNLVEQRELMDRIEHGLGKIDGKSPEREQIKSQVTDPDKIKSPDHATRKMEFHIEKMHFITKDLSEIRSRINALVGG